jgi:hypothetical protein
MPGGGGHRFEFIGEVPLIFKVLVVLLFANTLVLPALGFGLKYFMPNGFPDAPVCEALASRGIQYRAPELLCWYANWDITIQFVLLAMGAVVMLIYRKRVRYIPPRKRAGWFR